jgi:hypothetical protein
MSQPFEQQPQQRRKMHPLVIVGIVAGALLVLFVVLSVVAFISLGTIAPGLTGGDKPPKFAEQKWAERTLDDMTFEAPCEFGPGPNVAGELPQEVRNLVTSMRTYQGLGLPDNFLVMASHVIYKPQVEASLEGAMHGTVTEAAARLGDHKPKYDSSPIVVSGMEGRRSLYKRDVQGQTMHLDTLTVCKENQLWQVQVIYLHGESTKLADRVINSVKIDF